MNFFLSTVDIRHFYSDATMLLASHRLKVSSRQNKSALCPLLDLKSEIQTPTRVHPTWVYSGGPAVFLGTKFCT